MSLQYDASGKLIDGTQQMQYNGSTYDVVQNNTQGTLLASLARTVTTPSAFQTNYNARGVFITLNITVASGTGGLQVILRGTDPITGTAFQLNAAPTAITTIGEYVYELYPGIGAAPGTGGGWVNQTTSGALPRTWYINLAHVDATSYTYSLGYSLIL